MKKNIVTMLLVVLMSVTMTFAYSGGDGSAVAPYQIATAADLNQLSQTPADWGMYFWLTSDIDVSAYPNICIGTSGAQSFTGSFDGNFKTITGYTWTGSAEFTGLFGVIGTQGKVYALKMVGASLAPAVGTLGNLAGVVAGQNFGLIAGCTVDGTVTVAEKDLCVGGIVGENNGGAKVINCAFYGTVNSSAYGSYIGGIAGQNGGVIEDCEFAGAILADDNYAAWGDASVFYTFAGGIVGWNMGGTYNNRAYNGEVKFCKSSGAMNVKVLEAAVGGIAGYNSASITRCEVESAVNGIGSSESNPAVGGIAGINQNGTISKCAVSSVLWANTIADLGGIAGWNAEGGSIQQSYCLSIIYAGYANNVGGVVGRNNAQVLNCYSSWGALDVQARAASVNSGGVAGVNDGGSLTNTYATGLVESGLTNSAAGGVVGYNLNRTTDGITYSGTVANSFFSTAGTGLASVAGYNDNPAGITGSAGKTQAQMLDSATFIAAGWNLGWSGAEIWTTNGWYPIFVWELNAKYSGGQGTAAAPYMIAKAADFKELAATRGDWVSGVEFVMSNDIDLMGYDFTPIGKWFDTNGNYDAASAFNAKFDGQGNSITGFNPSEVALNPVGFGLFGIVGSNAVITSLGVTADLVHSYSQNCGILAGVNDGIIEKCWVAGSLYVNRGWSRVGGIAGINGGTVRDCFSLADIGGFGDAAHYGGICGDNFDGVVETCYLADYSILAGGTGTYVGAIIGAQAGGAVVNKCFYEDANPASPAVPAIAGQWGTVDIITGAKSNADMKLWSTFVDAGWNLGWTGTEVWTISGWYPVLNVFNN